MRDKRKKNTHKQFRNGPYLCIDVCNVRAEIVKISCKLCIEFGDAVSCIISSFLGHFSQSCDSHIERLLNLSGDVINLIAKRNLGSSERVDKIYRCGVQTHGGDDAPLRLEEDISTFDVHLKEERKREGEN